MSTHRTRQRCRGLPQGLGADGATWRSCQPLVGGKLGPATVRIEQDSDDVKMVGCVCEGGCRLTLAIDSHEGSILIVGTAKGL